MAGYPIYSLDWDKFRRSRRRPQPPATVGVLRSDLEGMDAADKQFEDNDPLRDWPSEPEELCSLIESRLKQADWYGDLSDAGKSLWDSALTGFCNGGKKDLGFRVESDGVYWDVIELAARHHGIQGSGITEAILSHFGTRPYRFHPPAGWRPTFGEWMPYHSMHTPDEVRRLLQELKEAGPTILSASQKDAKRDYEEELLPAVEKVARTGRLLYIAVDT